VDALEGAIGGLGPVTVREDGGEPEDMRFTVPKEVS
jgi:hypothetical protein